MMTSSHVALQVLQQAICALAKWAEVDLPEECQCPEDNDAIARAKKILSWTENPEIKPLRLLFDSVKLPDGKGQSEVHYWKAEAIANEHPTIPYPQPDPPTDEDLNKLKSQIKQALPQLEGNWNNLSLLTLILEKFGSCLSFGKPDIALIDMARSTAAVAAALVNNPEPSHLSLVAGDLSGIQKFIYTISSDGALKSLRARSFYLELVTEEVVQQILTELDLPRNNVIYAGGGNLYILASGDEHQINKAVVTIRDRFNKWLRTSFQGKVFLALDYVTLPTESVGIKEFEFTESWNQVPKKLAKQKLRKFESQLTDFLAPSLTYEPCRVCHRDDLPSLKPLKNRHELDSSPACWMCRTMFEIGDKLFKVEAVVRSKRSNIKGAVDRLYFPGFYYYLFEKPDEALAVNGAETVFLINNWKIEQYGNNTVPLLLGNYGKVLETEEDGKHFIRAGEMAEKAKGIKRVGYLRMDVDKLGQIFAKGLDEKQSLPRLAGLSRQMSYFFKVYLNSLAKFRKRDFLEPRKTVKVLEAAKCLKEEDERQNLLFIYAGGDDLFVSGAWNEVVEFAFDVYQCFRAYTGNNPDITLSGGISLTDIKFPLYQAAAESGKAEDAAKANGRDSLGLFGEKFKWSEWLGQENIEVSKIETFDAELKNYLGIGFKLELFGVLPFVKILEDAEIGYSRGFVRNLLDTANLQNQKIKEIEDDSKKEEYTNHKKDIRYYLHLPQIAYTLARLPRNVREHEKFKPVRTSLKSPYNAPYFRAIATWIELLNRSSNS